MRLLHRLCYYVTVVLGGLSQTISLYQPGSIPNHNASAKMAISTLFIFDLLIMHASRELARRLLYRMHRKRCVLSKEADGLRQHSGMQSGRKISKCEICTFSCAIVVVRNIFPTGNVPFVFFRFCIALQNFVTSIISTNILPESMLPSENRQ